MRSGESVGNKNSIKLHWIAWHHCCKIHKFTFNVHRILRAMAKMGNVVSVFYEKWYNLISYTRKCTTKPQQMHSRKRALNLTKFNTESVTTKWHDRNIFCWVYYCSAHASVVRPLKWAIVRSAFCSKYNVTIMRPPMNEHIISANTTPQPSKC